MNRKTPPLLLHTAGCVVFLSLPLLFSPEPLGLHSLTNPSTQRDIVAYTLVLVTFYLNFYFLIPDFYFPRKYSLFLVLNVLCFALITLLPAIIISPPGPGLFEATPPPDYPAPLFPDNTYRRLPGPLPEINQHLFLFLLVLFLALLLKIHDRRKNKSK